MTRAAVRHHTDVRARFPRGVATVRQLVEFGFSERTVYKRCRDGGPWQRILPGIVLLFTGRPTRDQEVLAAVLLCGPDSVVTGLEACRRHGIRRGPARPADSRSGPTDVHVLIPATRQVRSTGYVHVERTTRLPAPLDRGGVPLAPVGRACTDAARRLHRRGEITELLSDAVQRQLCSVTALASELAAGSRRGAGTPFEVLADLRDGVRSAAEQAAKLLWRRTGLPEPWWNASVYDADGRLLGIADCWVDDVAMVWEIESTQWHLSPADHDYTVERATTFIAAGATYTASKPKKVLTDPAGVAVDLRSIYEYARTRPRPKLRAVRASDR